MDEGMAELAEAGGGVRNGLPAIDHLCAMLDLLQRQPGGSTVRDLTAQLALARSSVYRSLNTLEARGVVSRLPTGAYQLGPKLLTWASQVAVEEQESDLARLAMPHLVKLSEITGEASKVSVLDGDRALVIAVAQGHGQYGLRISTGLSFPLHAGGASKLLLAYLPQAEQERVLAQPLSGHTRNTTTDRRTLAQELARIRKQGWASDRGEFSTSVNAIAAPIHDRAGQVVAAVSIPFLADRDRQQRERIPPRLAGHGRGDLSDPARWRAVRARLPAGGPRGLLPLSMPDERRAQGPGGRSRNGDHGCAGAACRGADAGRSRA